MAVNAGNCETKEITDSRNSNPLVIIFLIMLCFALLASLTLALRPSKIKQPTPIATQHIASLNTSLQAVNQCDQRIFKLERLIDLLETTGTGTGDEIKRYYQFLSDLYFLREERARYARSYNDIAHNLFTEKNISPIELRKAGLPTGIR